MANGGFFLGGFSQGFNQAREQRRQDKLAGLQEQALQAEQRKQQEEQVQAAIDSAFEQARQLREVGAPNEAIRPLFESALETSRMATRQGLNVVGPHVIERTIRALEQVPGREEQLRQEAERQRVLAQAKAEGTAAGTPDKPITVNPGQTVLDPSGNILFQARREPETFILSRGQRVVDAAGNIIAEGAPAEPDINEENVDVILPDGSRVPAVGRVVDGSLEVLDQQGRFRPATEVFPDAQSFEQARTRTQEIPPESQQFTRDTFVRPPGEIQGVAFEKGVGPLDAAARTLIGIPVLSQIFTEFAGEEAGEPQRQADRLFKLLQNQVLQAFRPSEDGRISNFQLQLAQKLVPDFGSFAQEKGTEADLRQLKAQAESLLESELFFANNPQRFDKNLVAQATQRAQALGRVITLTDALLSASNNPTVELSRILDKSPSDLNDRDIQDLGPQALRMESRTLEALLDNMSEEQQRKLLESMEAASGNAP